MGRITNLYLINNRAIIATSGADMAARSYKSTFSENADTIKILHYESSDGVVFLPETESSNTISDSDSMINDSRGGMSILDQLG